MLLMRPFLIVQHVVTSSSPELCYGAVTLPEEVTEIGDGAFSFCRGMTSVHLPEKITSIGKNAFLGCLSLDAVCIPEHVSVIQESAFEYCINLHSVTLPYGITHIQNCAFLHCKSLRKITFPETVISIAKNAFYGCRQLQQIDIPETVSFIGHDAFQGTAWIDAQHEKNSFVVVNQQLISARNTETEIVIPREAVRIGEGAFCGNFLTSVKIPEHVKEISRAAFCCCPNLRSVVIENPACEIADSANTFCNDFHTFTGKIFGFSGSSAEQYAEHSGYSFETL